MRNLVPVLTLAAVTSLLAQSSSQYRVAHTYTLGGDGGWDYIVPDPPNHRVFVVSAKLGPAPAGGRGRGPVLPGSFTLLVVQRDPATR